MNATQVGVGKEVVVAQAIPDRLLHFAGDAERREVPSRSRIREVARYAQLEAAVPIRGKIPISETGGGEFVPKDLHLRTRLPAVELALELLSKTSGYRRRIDEHESPRRGGRATGGRFAGVEERKQPTPGIADDGERLQLELGDQLTEVGYVRLPSDPFALRSLGSGASTTTLIVKDQIPPVCAVGRVEPKHLREEVIVVRPGSAVKQ